MVRSVNCSCSAIEYRLYRSRFIGTKPIVQVRRWNSHVKGKKKSLSNKQPGRSPPQQPGTPQPRHLNGNTCSWFLFSLTGPSWWTVAGEKKWDNLVRFQQPASKKNNLVRSPCAFRRFFCGSHFVVLFPVDLFLMVGLLNVVLSIRLSFAPRERLWASGRKEPGFRGGPCPGLVVFLLPVILDLMFYWEPGGFLVAVFCFLRDFFRFGLNWMSYLFTCKMDLASIKWTCTGM